VLRKKDSSYADERCASEVSQREGGRQKEERKGKTEKEAEKSGFEAQQKTRKRSDGKASTAAYEEQEQHISAILVEIVSSQNTQE
jgi:hypothetical protein